MKQKTILKSDDLKNIFPISENLNTLKRIDYIIVEVENLYVIPRLGATLYKLINDTINSIDSSSDSSDEDNYNELLNGCYYKCDKGYDFNPGLLSAIGYLVYSELLMRQNTNITAFGVVNENNEYSSLMSDDNITTQSRSAKKTGEAYMIEVVKYCKAIGLIRDCDECESISDGSYTKKWIKF